MASELIRRSWPSTGVVAARRPCSLRRTWPTMRTSPGGGGGAVLGIRTPCDVATKPRSTSTTPAAVRRGVTTSYPSSSPLLR